MFSELCVPATSWQRGGRRRTGHPTPVRLETARLLLRDLVVDDLDPMLGYFQDPAVLRYLNWTHPWTREQVRQSLSDERLNQRAIPRQRFDLGIVLRETGQLIGDCGLELLTPRDTPNHAGAAVIWFILRRDQWGHGYATEAARAVVGMAFTDLGLRRVFGGCHPENTASRRILERLGMLFDGVHDNFPGSPEGIRAQVFHLDRDRWLALSQPSFDLMQGPGPPRIL